MATKKEITPKTGAGTQLDVRREWEHPFASFQKEMNKLFDDFFGGFDLTPWPHSEGRLAATFTPRVDVSETDKEIKVSAELPGMDEKDLDVSLTRDTLTIKGEKKRENESKEEDTYRSERYYGSFSRSMTLPAAVDANRIEAGYKDGVLEIVIPKSEEAKPKQIKIQG